MSDEEKKGSLQSEKTFVKFNKAFVSGRIEADFKYDHEILGEKFYRTRIKVQKTSGAENLVPIIVSYSLIGSKNIQQSFKDKFVEVTGQFRSHNKLNDDGHKSLELFLFVMAIHVYEDKESLEESLNSNLVYLDGYLCKPPVYRKTHLGRQSTNLLIAVNRDFGKSSYIPCVALDRVALSASTLEVGNRVQLYGEISSRKYFKKFSPTSKDGEYKVAYEISVIRFTLGKIN